VWVLIATADVRLLIATAADCRRLV